MSSRRSGWHRVCTAWARPPAEALARWCHRQVGGGGRLVWGPACRWFFPMRWACSVPS